MAFNAGAIVAKLKLDSKDFNTGIKKSAGNTEKLTNAAKKNQRAVRTQGQRLKAGGIAAGKFGAAIGGASLAIIGLTRAAKQIGELITAGARLRDMEMAFDRLAKRAGTSAGAVVASVQDITGALSKQKIMESANMLELLGVGMEHTARLTEIARAAGVALGKDVGFMLESIATGTARQSRLWLDNLGIIITVEDANKEYAKTLGKVASELTDTERRAAFLHAVLNKGGDIIAAVGTDSELASEGVATLGASIKNLADTIKKDLGSASDEMGGFTKTIQGMEIAWKNFGLFGILPGMFTRKVGGGDLGSGTQKYGASGFGQSGGPTVDSAIGPTNNMLREETDKYAAQVAADAKKFFDDLLQVAKQQTTAPHTPIGVGAGRRITGTSLRNLRSAGFDSTQPRATIDWAEAPDAMSEVGDNMEDVNEGLQQGANLASNFFTTLVTGAASGGAKFESILMGAIASVASGLGQMIQWGGKGLGALGSLNPFAAIVAGTALMGIAGLMRSRGSSSSPSVAYATPSMPQAQEAETQGGGVHIHVENFMGDQAWVERFMRTVNNVSRSNGYTEVFFDAS